jgi:hypothetical protein
MSVFGAARRGPHGGVGACVCANAAIVNNVPIAEIFIITA